MTALTDYQFELDGYVFGLGKPVEVEAGGFGPAGLSWRDSDTTFRDSNHFGRDYLTPGSWSFAMFTNVASQEGALAAYGTLKGAWRGRSVARTPGAVQVLRYALGGRTRCIYGRSRRCTPSPNNYLISGRLDIVADFALADGRTFSDEQSSASAQVSPSVTGGFDVPFFAPLVTESTSVDGRPGQFVVGGDAPTPLVVRFYGPASGGTSSDPHLQIGDLEVSLPGVIIGPGQWVEVDARPWVRAAVRSDGGAVGTLARSTNLGTLELAPGGYEAVYTALDPTNTSYATVSWRDAYDSL